MRWSSTSRYVRSRLIARSQLPSWRWHWPMLKRNPGSGAIRYASTFSPLGVAVEDVVAPLAGIAARLAIDQPERAVAPHALRPIYIRRPDAVLARERASLSGP